MKEVWSLNCDTPGQKLVLLALADCSREDSGCWPSLSTLQKKCSMSRQGILNQITTLEGKGWIAAERGTRGQSTIYRLTIPVHAVDYSPEKKHAFKVVHSVDQSTPLTSPQSGPPPVHSVDHRQSIPLTTPVHSVDCNRNEPEVEPEVEPSAEALLIFLCNGKVKEWALTREKISEWEDSFPDTDVMACCRKALQWTRDKQKKTARGMTAFLGGWIARSADRGECRRAAPIEREEWIALPPIDMMADLRALKAAQEAAIIAEGEERWM